MVYVDVRSVERRMTDIDCGLHEHCYYCQYSYWDNYNGFIICKLDGEKKTNEPNPDM